MSNATRASLSIVVAVVATTVAVDVPGTLAEVSGGALAGVGLVVFIRAVMSLAGGSGEQRSVSAGSHERWRD
jgi:hypothetical protein